LKAPQDEVDGGYAVSKISKNVDSKILRFEVTWKTATEKAMQRSRDAFDA